MVPPREKFGGRFDGHPRTGKRPCQTKLALCLHYDADRIETSHAFRHTKNTSTDCVSCTERDFDFGGDWRAKATRRCEPLVQRRCGRSRLVGVGRLLGDRHSTFDEVAADTYHWLGAIQNGDCAENSGPASSLSRIESAYARRRRKRYSRARRLGRR